MRRCIVTVLSMVREGGRGRAGGEGSHRGDRGRGGGGGEEGVVTEVVHCHASLGSAWGAVSDASRSSSGSAPLLKKGYAPLGRAVWVGKQCSSATSGRCSDPLCKRQDPCTGRVYLIQGVSGRITFTFTFERHWVDNQCMGLGRWGARNAHNAWAPPPTPDTSPHPMNSALPLNPGSES